MLSWLFDKPVLAALIVMGTALLMEPIALFVHRYWMHGIGWTWHRSHHQPRPTSHFERNDLFGAFFAAIAVALTVVGDGAWWPLFWVGIGMTVYGGLYALMHDGLVHRRWPVRWMPRRGYLRRLVQAHRLHHAVTRRKGAVSFGFLYAPPVGRLVAELRARRVAPDAEIPSPGGHRSRQGRVGFLLALMLIGTWLLAMWCGLFAYRWTTAGILLAPLWVAIVCWLDVGLFIVAHDAMHGSLIPTHRRLNVALGRLCLALYAGFAIGRFTPLHFEHHRGPGTGDDPDFHVEAVRFWPWYLSFMRRYFGWREASGLLLIFALLTVVLRAPLINVLVFWAAPAMLSSIQLFAFGTWLPHRKASMPFDDTHRARSNAYGWWVSLLTCFHFGYHHEHHLRPDAPWWELPSVRRNLTRHRPAPDAATSCPAASSSPSRDAALPCSPPR